MNRITPVFYVHVFFPSRGAILRLVVLATTDNAETAEVENVFPDCLQHMTGPAWLEEDEKARADDVASDALETICARVTPGCLYWEAAERVEADTKRLAEAAQGRWFARSEADGHAHPHYPSEKSRPYLSPDVRASLEAFIQS